MIYLVALPLLSFFLDFCLFIYICVFTLLGLRCCGFSLVAASGGYSLVVVGGLLIAVPSFVVEHRFQGVWASVAACGLSCPVACGILLDQGPNPCPLHWQADS